MYNGIAIIGLNGAGKSTLAHVLAKKLHYFEIDVEDYYFPAQRSSRINALEGKTSADANFIPYLSPKAKSEVEFAIRKDINCYPQFVLSGVTLNWSESILSQIDIAFYLHVPLNERLQRIRSREAQRFGSRILPGGDMYDQHIEFLNKVENRSEQEITRSLENLSCPVVNVEKLLPLRNDTLVIHFLQGAIKL